MIAFGPVWQFIVFAFKQPLPSIGIHKKGAVTGMAAFRPLAFGYAPFTFTGFAFGVVK